MKRIFKRLITCACALSLLITAAAMCVPTSAAADTAFDEKNVVLSFGVMTDLHLKAGDPDPEAKFNRAAEVTEQFAGRVPDAIMFGGDYTYEGREDEARLFLNQAKKLYDPTKTAMVVAYGNHDTYWTGCMKPDGWYEVLKELFHFQAEDSKPQAGNHHVVVNGFHFLTVELKKYNPNVYATETKVWLENTLDAIVDENPNQPIFVITHAAMQDTIYGSDRELEEAISKWGTSNDLNTVLQYYPQVVLFSGHSHYGLGLDRAIMQTDYTAVQAGSVVGLDISYSSEKSQYTNASHSSLKKTSQGLLVEVDKKGVTRITRIDYTRGEQIGEPWIIKKTDSRKGSHLKDYAKDRGNIAAPVIDEASLKVTAAGNSGFTVSFDYPKTDATMYNYIYTVKQNGQTVKTYNVLSEWWNHPQGIETESFTFTQWNSEISVTPIDEWGNEGKTVTVKVADADTQTKTWAADADAKIAAIGTVTKNSKAAIEAARAAYNELNDAAKALVTKLDVLEAAEKAFADLSNATTKPVTTTKPGTGPTSTPVTTLPTEPATEPATEPDTAPDTAPDTEPDTAPTVTTSTPAADATTTATAPSDDTPTDAGNGAPVGLIAGIAAGAVVVIALVVVLVLMKKRKA